MTQFPGIKPEWSFEIMTAAVKETPVTKQAKASELECKDIARRLDLLAVEGLEATVTLKREGNGVKIHAEGAFKALVTQKCVVTLDPVQSTIEETFETWFAEDSDQIVSLDRVRQEKRENSHRDLEVEIPDEKDDPEKVIEGRIELGEIIIQNLALALDPYPHAEGATYKDICEHPDSLGDQAGRHKPFAGLKTWKETWGKED